MLTHTLTQGSAEWLAHRRQFFNASDAPAMMSCSPYKTRDQLLHEMHTGLTAEVDAATQRRFDDGHRYEALARPHAAAIVGEELFPVTGSEGKLSASFDGLTMAEDTAFEHKTLNAELRACMRDEGNGWDLPKHYQVQMEQQLMVSGAERVLFMASKWEGDTLIEFRHCWYASDPKLRAQIVAGWEQFDKDLGAYVPAEGSAKLAAAPVESLPAVLMTVTGEVSVSDNFKVFETRLRDFLENHLIRKPETDQDFVDLDQQIKAMKDARETLKAGKAQMLAQVQPIDQANKTADMLDKLLQQNCKMAEDLLTAEKERRRGEIVAGGVAALRDHVAALNGRFTRPYMPAMPAAMTDFGGAIKGKKNLDSMQSAVNDLLAKAKIEASRIADGIDVNVKYLNEQAGDTFRGLFADVATIVLKAADDFKTLVDSRITTEKTRLDAERERIAQEARDRLLAEQEEQRKADEAAKPAPVVVAAPAPAPTPATVDAGATRQVQQVISQAQAAAPVQSPAPAVSKPAGPPDLKLGQICDRLGFNVTAAFLSDLGYPPALKQGAANLYYAADYDRICLSLIEHIQKARETVAA